MRYLFFLLLLASLLSCKEDAMDKEFQKVTGQLPEIGPFMYRQKSLDSIANWLGRPADDGRGIYEPINMILVDDLSTSSGESKARVYEAFTKAGFKSRFGHSSNYFGWMADSFYAQIPSEDDMAFSDFMWVFTNNHARVFGPYKSSDYWFWIASSSQEKGTIHDYVSFAQSRDKMAKNMEELAGCKMLGKFPMKNLVNNPETQTGDHDGFATVIKLQ